MKIYFLLFLTLLSIDLNAQVNLNAGLVAYFPFAGNTIDASGNGNNATNNGATLTTDQWGNANSAYLFNGNSDFMEIPNSTSLQLGSFTLCARVKPITYYNGLCFNNVILAKGNSAGYGTGDYALTYTPTLNQNPSNYCYIQDSLHENYRTYAGSSGAQNSLSCINSVNGIPYISTNNWDCVIGVYNDTTHVAKVYVNGSFRYSYSIPNSISTNSDNIFFGKQNTASYEYWMHAALDEVRIYNRVLNIQEIDSICNLTFIPNLDSVVCNFNFSYPNNCDSTVILFSDQSLAFNSTIVGWNWDFGDGNSSLLQNPSHNYTNAGIYNVRLIVTSSTNKIDTFYSNVIAINNVPSITASASPQTLCQGASTVLTASGASTYSWSNGVTNGVSFIPSATTTYTVTGTNANLCSATTTIYVTVNPLPTILANASPNSVCAGKPTTLFGLGAQSYTWSGGVTNAVPFVPTSSGTYTVTGTDANGCSNTSSVSISILANPIISTQAAPSTICFGASTVVTASGASSYNWTNGILNGVSFTPTSTSIYTVTAAATNGCTNTATQSVTVNPLPLVSCNANPNTLCLGGSTILNGSGTNSYVWSNGVIDGVLFNPSSTTTYTVTGTDLNGCTNTSTVLVTVIPGLQLNILNTEPLLCVGDSSFLTASGGSSYQWSPGTGLNSTSGVSVWANPTITTTYTVTGTDANGCTGIGTTLVDVISGINLVVSKSNDIECGKNSAELIATGGANYSWSPANLVSNSNGNTTTTIIDTTTTIYVTATLGTCIATDSITINFYNSDGGTTFIPSAFSPNQDGTNDCFRIKSSASFKEYYLAIYNRWGQRVYESNNANDCWNGLYNGDPAAVGTYYYYLKATTSCGKILKKGDVTLVR